MENTWPGGYRHAMTQAEHDLWNAFNYPGTRQLCSRCKTVTGTYTIWSPDDEPLCEQCARIEEAEGATP
jgi:hypothetical protein